MPDEFAVSLNLKQSLARLALGTATSMLVVTFVGSIVGLATLSVFNLIYKGANQWLSAAGFVVNLATLLLVVWLFSLAIARASSADLLIRNRVTLIVARFVTVVAIFQLTYGFIAGEARTFVVVRIGNITSLDFMTTTWAIVLGVVVPAAILVGLFVFSPRWLGSARGGGA